MKRMKRIPDGRVHIWMNLLGFERNDRDRGAKRFLKQTGFVPDGICALLFHPDFVHHHMGMEVTPKQMSTRIAANVQSEFSPFIRLMPLFLKNIALKAAFLAVGERKQCLSLSNLGNVKLPPEMSRYVDRMDFILAPQASAPHNCGVLSYNGTLYVNFIRSIREPELEAHFYQALRQQGLHVMVESNRKE